MKIKKYHTVWTKWKTKIIHVGTKWTTKDKKYYTVGTKWKTKNTTLSEQNKKKIPFCLNIKKRKKTTLSEQNEQ